jgi:hypothetical protein
MLKNLDFKKGKIVYDDFDIKEMISFEDQVFSLKEDLFQVNYQDKYIIDIGWYPEFDPKGKFTISVIKDFDWINPIFIKKSSILNRVTGFVEEAIEIVDKLLDKN